MSTTTMFKVGSRMNTGRTDIPLIEALRQALAEPGEQRLFRSGKLPGLFTSRTGTAGEAAERAVRDRLLDVVRTESKGKVHVEWVRPTPAGVEFLHAHESPRAVLEDLRETLALSQAGVPKWLDELRNDLGSLSKQMTATVDKLTARLDSLALRVDEAMRRTDMASRTAIDGSASEPWAPAALGYLDKRATAGVSGDCPLPELYSAVRKSAPDLSLTAFHDGLKRLRDKRAVRLTPFVGAIAALPEPEFAMLDGATVLYFAGR